MSPEARARVPLTRIGKYVLLEVLAESTMSALYLARVTLGSTHRLVVIKMLSPASISEARNRKLFFNEIEISMALNHPSIARLYDFGEHEGAPFIVMEWVPGVDARRLLAKIQEASLPSIPPPLAGWIMLETAKALHYAHTFTDPLTGKVIGFVHRDMSPHNIVVSNEGVVKLIDFGISKAIGNQDTKSDMIMGKAPYLSPEQAEGKKLDARSDLFSLGAVFFELLTGRRLFDGEDDFAAMAKVKAAGSLVPAALLEAREIPPVFAPILSRCLEPAREKRYSSCAELHQELTRACVKLGEPCGREPLSRFVKMHFAGEIELERARVTRLLAGGGGEDEDEDDVPLGSFPELDLTESAPPPAQLEFDARHRVFTEDAPVRLAEAPRPAERPAPERPEPEKPRRRIPSPAIATVLLVTAIGGGASWFALNPESQVKLLPAGELMLDVQPGSGAGAEILLDGRILEAGKLDAIPVSYDLAHHLVVKMSGFDEYTKTFYLDPPEKGGSGKLQIPVDLVPARFGNLSVSTDVTATAEITGGAGTWKKKAPFRDLKLPPGKYTLRLKEPGFFGKWRQRSVELAEGQPVLVGEKLEE